MKTQEDIILQALKSNPDGVHPTYIISDLHIYQYNARLKGLRDRFGCICKNGNTVCPATEHIINKRYKNGTTRFFYKQTANPLEWLKDARDTSRQKSENTQESLF